jgi:type IV pilus assembly protein PilN
MILINLLPHREEKRRLRKQAFFVVLGMSVVAGLVLVALWYAFLQQMIAAQEARNGQLSTAITKLEDEIKDVASLKAEIDSLKARQKAVEDLQTDRNIPVYLLNELVKQVPEGVYLKDVRQDGNFVLLAGLAQTNERVSELLRNTAYNSPWLEKPDLQEIKAVTLAGEKKDAKQESKRLFEFSVRLGIKRPEKVDEAATAASAPAARASAAAPASKASGT